MTRRDDTPDILRGAIKPHPGTLSWYRVACQALGYRGQVESALGSVTITVELGWASLLPWRRWAARRHLRSVFEKAAPAGVDLHIVVVRRLL